MNFDERMREERLKIDDAKIKGVRNVCEFADEQLTDERIGEIQADLGEHVRRLVEAVRTIQNLQVQKSMQPIENRYTNRYTSRYRHG